MLNYAPDLLRNLGYANLFNPQANEQQLKISSLIPWIEQFNERSRKLSIYNLHEAENITSIVCNYPALLLRKKSEAYPEGRTSYRFKRELRKKVTVVGKTSFGQPRACVMTEAD